jgi:hypothetical protein
MQITKQDIMIEVNRVAPIICKRCINQIPNFEILSIKALSIMHQQQEPLKIVERELYDSIQNIIIEYYDEQEISYEYDEDFEDIINGVLYHINRDKLNFL